MSGDRTLRGAAAIVGVADAVSPTGELEIHGRALEAAVVREALADAGLTIADVDGVTYAGQVAPVAEYLGVHPRFVDGTGVGGSSFEIHVEHAAAAIAAGLCDVVLGVYAATPRAIADDREAPTAPPASPVRLPVPSGISVRSARGSGPMRAREPAHGHLRHDARNSLPASPPTPGSGRP